MATSEHTIVINAEEATLWNFLKENGEWATLIPGYLHHEFPSLNEMIWVFKGDFGFIQKAVKLQLKVTDLEENKKVGFDLIGLSDNINGGGSFEMEEVTNDCFKLTGKLKMEGGGFLSGMINPVLEKFVPETVVELVSSMGDAVGQKMK